MGEECSHGTRVTRDRENGTDTVHRQEGKRSKQHLRGRGGGNTVKGRYGKE